MNDNKPSQIKYYPLWKAWGTILLSTALLSGSAYSAYFIPRYIEKVNKEKSQYTIVALTQSTNGSEMVQNGYLAELLHLSIDNPTNLYAFNEKHGEALLKNSPLFKNVSIKKITPGTLHVDYNMRSPTLYLGDFANCAIDKEGVIIPFEPFFSPRDLPIVTLGADYFSAQNGENPWGRTIDTKEMKLIETTLDHFPPQNAERLVEIDLSKNEELIATIYTHKKRKSYLRIPIDTLSTCLRRYKKLNEKILSKNSRHPTTVDFRPKQAALIEWEYTETDSNRT